MRSGSLRCPTERPPNRRERKIEREGKKKEGRKIRVKIRNTKVIQGPWCAGLKVRPNTDTREAD